MERDLADQVAIVTGSARNIGRAIALELASAGAAVVVTCLKSEEAAADVVNEIQACGGRAISRAADLREPAQIKTLVTTAIETFGRLDIVVNNAAVRKEAHLETVSYEDWRHVLSVILDGAFLMTQAAIPHLKKSKRASVINIGGMTAHLGAPDRASILTGKIGLIGLTRALAHDLAPYGVTVNCVVPGLINTIRGESASVPLYSGGKAPPIGRRGVPDDIASLVHYLVGPRARYITGQTVHANGGAFMP